MECDENGRSDLSQNELLQWNQWQLVDSVLPTGGFAHSYGLEAAVQTHFVASSLDLNSYIIQVLENVGSLLLPFVYCAHKSPDAITWSKLDRLLEATLTNEVSRKASASQGSALLRVAASVYKEVPSLKRMRDTFLGSGTVSFHHAPIFGLICGLLGFDSSASQRMYMFMTMRDVISAATRLNVIGPLGASSLQHQLAPIAEELTKKWRDRPVEEACQGGPVAALRARCKQLPYETTTQACNDTAPCCPRQRETCMHRRRQLSDASTHVLFQPFPTCTFIHQTQSPLSSSPSP